MVWLENDDYILSFSLIYLEKILTVSSLKLEKG